jgi:tetratricopeptide (TPR) repeat protein
MKNLFLIMISIMLMAGQESETDTFLKDFSKKLYESHYDGNEKKFQLLRAELERVANINSEDWYIIYYQAYIYNQLGTFNLTTNEDKADEYFDKAIELLENAIKIKDNAELHAMYADILGKKISISSFRGMTLGPKSQSEIAAAKKLNSNIPYVMLTEAINLMMTPGFFGGDKEESRKILNNALIDLDSFKHEDEKMINISKADIYAWLCQLDLMEDKMESARENADKALALQSDYAFVKYGLIPKLKE